ELTAIFATRTVAEWLEFGEKVNTPIAPFNTPQNIGADPQFQARLGWIPKERLGADQLPTPIKYIDEKLPVPEKAPTVGEHNDAVLRDILGYDDARIAALKEVGALG
ncbi:MAG TPA: CoA transferase, partial [Nocardioides sp.]|nr:CoA transferase [Nocardioides sp.]